jgi:hypothetical protein
MKSAEWFRSRAKELYHEEGEIEIDGDARVSTGVDQGAYVQAWVWVPFETTPRSAVPERHRKKRISVRSRQAKSSSQEA